MATLFEKLQENLATLGSPQAEAGNQSLKARNLLAARSGKAVAAPSAAMSTVAEDAAVDQTNAQLAQVGTAGSLAADQIAKGVAQQAAEEKQARSGIALQQSAEQLQNRFRTQNLLAELERDKGSLNIEKDRSRLEQLASGIALQDRKYLDELQREGTRKRLDNKIAFEEELARSVMGSSTDILKKYLGDQSALAMSDRQFQRLTSQMSLDDALSMARGNQQAAQQAGMWSAAGGLAGAGINAYSTKQAGGFDEDYTNYKADNGKLGYASWKKQRGQE